MNAEDLVSTDAERACLVALRAATAEVNGPMEFHCVRQFAIAERLGQQNGLDVDREVLLCASLLHDAGLYPSVSTGDVYTRDSKRLGERVLADFSWDAVRLKRCLDAIEQHHALRNRWQWGAEVELTRRADLVEVSAGTIPFGLPRVWLRSLSADVPRRGFYKLIGQELLRGLRERPMTIPGIVRPSSRPPA